MLRFRGLELKLYMELEDVKWVLGELRKLAEVLENEREFRRRAEIVNEKIRNWKPKLLCVEPAERLDGEEWP